MFSFKLLCVMASIVIVHCHAIYIKKSNEIRQFITTRTTTTSTPPVSIYNVILEWSNPDNRQSVNILGYQCETFETEVRRSMRMSRAQVENPDANAFGDHITFIPLINQLAGIFELMQKLLSGESDWRMEFSKTIQDQTHRVMADNELRVIEASMETISQNFRYLNESSDFTVESKTSIVHNLHDDLDKIVNQFYHRDAIFRKYPLLAVPPLFTIASYITFYNKIENALVPALANRSDISCKLVNTLTEYRPLAVHQRLNMIQVTDTVDPALQKNAAMAKIEDLKYNKTGYRAHTSQTYDCSRACEERWEDSEIAKMCWIDPFQFGHYSTVFRGYECLSGYMGLLRYRVEKAFNEAIDLAIASCTDAKQKLLRSSPGYGWFSSIIQSVMITKKCDVNKLFFIPNKCDPYVKVLVDGQEVFRTTVKEDRNDAKFFERFRTGKILKTARISVEIWDHDAEDDDDWIASCTMHIDQFQTSNTFNCDGSTINMTSKWEDA